MIQDQLVEYISSQLKLGISRETLKSALVGVGWAAQDVEDTMKKVESPAVSVSAVSTPVQTAPAQGAPLQPQKQPMTTASIIAPAAVSKVSSAPMGMGGVKSPEPQMIRVSDLVSSGSAGATSSISSFAATQAPKSNSMSQGALKTGPAFQGAQFVQKPQGKFGVVTMVLAVLVLLLAGFSGYLLFRNNMTSSNTSGTAATSDQLTALQAQVQATDASNTALTAQVTSMTAQNQDILNNLALTAPVPSLAPANGATSSPISLSGVLSLGVGKSALYTLTTSYGTKAYVKNSADALVKAALQSLIGTSAPVQISGTFVPGNPNITVTAVNGNPIVPPMAATTTSATTTGQ